MVIVCICGRRLKGPFPGYLLCSCGRFYCLARTFEERP